MAGILIVGGTGVFGSRLAEGLVLDGHHRVTIAGRRASIVQQVAARIGCQGVTIDRDAPDLAEKLREIAPEIVIDAAGPFQAYADAPYRLVEAALSVGAHVLDLSDDGVFTAGIDECDCAARDAYRVVRSGVSSVPAISAAAVHDLSKGLAKIERIDTAILPGNRAPRGRSVVAAILAQVGRPLAGWPDVHAWIGSERKNLPGIRGTRRASPIGAPDLVLFQKKFGVNDVRFRAGLELSILHHGLTGVAWLKRLGLLRRPENWAGAFQKIASLFEGFGTDEGGMIVQVIGRTPNGARERRNWILVAAAGKGPHIPALPARILVRKILAGTVATGATPCLEDLTITDIEQSAPELNLRYYQETEPWQPVFQTVLGADFEELPGPLSALHDVTGRSIWDGQITVTRGTGPLATMIASLFRFPAPAKNMPLSVTMVRQNGAEHWVRDMNGRKWRSVLRPDPAQPGRIWERFGPFSFAIDLNVSEGALHYPVSEGRLLGIALPRILLPKSVTQEAVDEKGRATFDVALSLPLVGDIVQYSGWLMPADQPIIGDQAPSTSS